MRLPHVRGFALMIAVSVSSSERRYLVELWEQPLHRWLVARLYHWYDMRVHRLPGYGLLERIKEWRYRNREWHEYLPISAVQDLRCYYLGERGRTVYATLDLPDGVYQRITGKT